MTPLITPFKQIIIQGRKIYIKDESKQISGAFKYRGAYHFISKRTKDNVGFCTASTGNHGIGVAIASQKNNKKARVFLPSNVSIKKKDSILKAGGRVSRVEGDYSACVVEAKAYANSHLGWTYVPSFDHPDIIDGQKKIFTEIDSKNSGKRIMFVPVGGGGLVSAALIHYKNTETTVIGVEEDVMPAMTLSLKKKKNIVLPCVRGKADALAVRQVGDLTLSICIKEKLRMLTVSAREMETAMRELADLGISPIEYGGAAAVAAALQFPKTNRIVICIISGGNLDE